VPTQIACLKSPSLSLKAGCVTSAIRQLLHAWDVGVNKSERMKLLSAASKTTRSRAEDGGAA
jgi:hypothetical protein